MTTMNEAMIGKYFVLFGSSGFAQFGGPKRVPVEEHENSPIVSPIKKSDTTEPVMSSFGESFSEEDNKDAPDENSKDDEEPEPMNSFGTTAIERKNRNLLTSLQKYQHSIFMSLML